jgi:Flp pilus assembly protein TadG
MIQVQREEGMTMKLPIKRNGRAAKQRRGEEGQAIVEFALVLPMLMVIMMGIFGFGLYIANFQMLTTAVSAGGQALSRDRNVATNGSGDPCADTLAAMEQAAPTLNTALLTSITITMNGTPVSGTGSSFTCKSSASAMSTTAVNGVTTGGSVTVHATYTTPCLVPFVKFTCIPLQSQITEYEF